MSARYDEALLPAVKLNSQQRWSEWITLLESYAKIRKLWETIDPYKPSKPDDLNVLPEPMTLDQAKEDSTKYGITGEPTFDQLMRIFEAGKTEYASRRLIYTEREKNEQTVRTWIAQTVEPSIYTLVTNELSAKQGDFSIRELLKGIKTQIAPSYSNMVQTTRLFYKETLREASQGNTRPDLWYIKWIKAYHEGSFYNIPEVQGTLAIREFIQAVGTRMAPDWAQTIETDLIRLERKDQEPQSVLEYAAEFNAFMQMRAPQQTRKGAYATLDESSGSQNRPHSASADCPCGRKHAWKPTECYTVQNAFTGKGKLDHNFRNQVQQKTLHNERFSEVRKALILKGIITDESKVKRDSRKSIPSNIVAVTIDPTITEQAIEMSEGVYTTIGTNRHPLSSCTLLDNCGALHLVNDHRLLSRGSFKSDQGENYVEAGTSYFRITGRGTRIIKSIFTDKEGNETIDLTLNEVAVVPDFHVNIVSEALLRKAGAWYIGFDCTLRFGDPSSSVILKRLVRKHNLTFLDYHGPK